MWADSIAQGFNYNPKGIFPSENFQNVQFPKLHNG